MGDCETNQTHSSTETHIGRRAFIGLMLAGIAALFLGKEILPRIPAAVTGSTGAGRFRINTIVPGEDFDPDTWRLTVDGLFRQPLTLTYPEFTDLPQKEFVRDFYCVEGWGVPEVSWKGVALRDLMERADIDPSADHLVFESSDGVYTESVTLEEAMRPDTLLVHELDGVPLEPAMGQPLRLVLPGSYGYKDIKWVVRVEAVAVGPEGYNGYWEQRGYPADASIR
jgi:DMSO/TMAO reductase YedYZ molybdopterin-dependent catalytic subunit